MSNAKQERLCQEIRAQMRASIAAMVTVGLELADSRQLLGANFERWCVEACRVPLAEAELLMRFALARPLWVKPEAVNLDDPMAPEVFEVAIHHTSRQQPQGVA